MAKNPKVEQCPVDKWHKAAAGITCGDIVILSTKAMYLYTYRIAGAKMIETADEGAMIDGRRLSIDSKSPIDVYIKAIRAIGVVRVDDLG